MRGEQHGFSYSSEYGTWKAMRHRCQNPTHADYDSYGGRGITVCDEWRGSFLAFYRDMGARPSQKYTLERLDNDKGYSKDNCIWATRSVQQANKRDTHRVTFQGRTQALKQWAKELGFSPGTLHGRYKQNPDPEYLFSPISHCSTNKAITKKGGVNAMPTS